MTNAPRQQDLGLSETGPIENVEEYRFEPIKGYPMLHWRGKRPFTSTVYYPAQHQETYGDAVDGWRNRLYWGDNLQVMSHLLKEFRGQISLIYIDPPFDSKAEYKKKVTLKGKTVRNDSTVFEEKQYTDLWTNDEYLQFMFERLILMRELLSPNGSIYVHCDWHKSHHLRCILEEIFGVGGKDDKVPGFRNEIVWCYSDAANSKKYWNTKHDTILFATKGTEWTFNYKSVLRPITDATIKKYRFEDEKGRYRLFGKNIEGSPIRWHRDVDPKWEQTNPELVFRHYIKSGSLPLDWWTINPVNQVAKERENYPTQKPEELLERIVLASSKPGDLVFDCFMGSGTAQAVSMKLGRRFIGADINLGAVQISTKRLISISRSIQSGEFQLQLPEFEVEEDEVEAEVQEQPTTFYTGLDIYNVNQYDFFRNPAEARDLILQALEVNRLQAGQLFDGEKDGRVVKVMPINRIATRQDLNELINGFDYKSFERRQADHPTQPVERITLVCMGHEPSLAAHLQQEVPYKLDVQVVDILRDKQDLQFKRDSEARVVVREGKLVIERFYPMNLLSKLSMEVENVTDWRELVESVMIDWNYDGAVIQPTLLDIPEDNELVAGSYPIPEDAGTIRVKITDLLSESLEVEVRYG